MLPIGCTFKKKYLLTKWSERVMQLWALFHACWQSELHIPSNFLFPTFEFLHIIFVASWLKEHGRPVVVISRLRPKKKGEKIGNATRGERWCGLSRCRGLPFPTKRMRWPFWQRNVFFSLSLSLPFEGERSIKTGCRAELHNSTD